MSLGIDLGRPTNNLTAEVLEEPDAPAYFELAGKPLPFPECEHTSHEVHMPFVRPILVRVICFAAFLSAETPAFATPFLLSLDASNCAFCSGQLSLSHDLRDPLFEFTGLQQIRTTSMIDEFAHLTGDSAQRDFQYQVAYTGGVLFFRLFDGDQKPGFQEFEGKLEISIATLSEDIFEITIMETRSSFDLGLAGVQETRIEGRHDRDTLPNPSVPEPSLIAIFALGILGSGLSRRHTLSVPVPGLGLLAPARLEKASA